MGTYTRGVAVAGAVLLSQPRDGKQGRQITCIHVRGKQSSKGDDVMMKTDKDWRQYELLCRKFNPVG